MGLNLPAKNRFFDAIAVLLCTYVLVSIAVPALPEGGALGPLWDALALFYPRELAGKLALFAMLGLILVFLSRPLHPRWKDRKWAYWIDVALCFLTLVVFGYLLVMIEPAWKFAWIGDRSIGDRVYLETTFELGLGIVGLVLVLEAARRCIGWTLSILSVAFLAYGLYGNLIPSSLLGHDQNLIIRDVVGKTFLQDGGVLGIALGVMFKYVFLFVVFGAILEANGATTFIIRFARRVFRNSVGGPAKVSVVSSGLMGSLSGSAVANTATTGAFTIPLMHGTGFTKETAGGVEAAASSGGALMPPIMGAGAYMMLELLSDQGVKYMEILQAAIIPAILYYFALLVMVHWQARKIGVRAESDKPAAADLKLEPMGGILFVLAFTVLIFLLLPPFVRSGNIPPGLTPDKAAALAILVVLALGWLHPSTRLGPKVLVKVLSKAARSGVILVAAAACVGIVLGIVELTGLDNELPSRIVALSENSLLGGLAFLMVATILLGMGLPSVVCYLLMARIVGGMIAEFGVPHLSMHLFIFYFSMMSMVTPPIALAAYAASAISGGNVMKTAFRAFGFALVGFALPFAFVLKPELLMLSSDGTAASMIDVAFHVWGAIAAILLLAAGIVGYTQNSVSLPLRVLLLGCALAAFMTRTSGTQLWIHMGAIILGLLILFIGWNKRDPAQQTPQLT